jgi:MoaA/NifB/PqqE/SkfB family radical SAM enzyme
VPGDEEEIGGCLSAGKGFIHISADGNVEPCPFAPYSDTNLRESSLREALQSEFLREIRENHERLSEAEGGCALWVERAWVRSLLHGGEGPSS